MNFSFHPDAENELEDALDFYDDREFGLGSHFLDEVRATVDRIIEYPNSWPVYSHRTRRCLCNRFPYSVIYRVFEGEITIFAVAHQSRKPGYWEYRLA